MSEKMELAELAQKFRNNASAVLTGDQVADEILNWAADFTIVRASSPAQESVTTEPEDIVWSRVNSEPFEYAIQQGPHGDEFVKLINGKCLKRSCAPLLAIPAPPQPGREEIAKIVYDAFDFSPTMGTPHKPEWMPGGNSFMQDRARRAANAILNLIGEPK